MSRSILKWLGGNDVGASSKAIALAAMGEMPPNPSYPHDADDFGRCRRLLALTSDAARGLDILSRKGGPVWAALVARWTDIELAFVEDEKTGWKQHTCYDLMKSIIHPIEDASGKVIRFGKGASLRF